MATLLTKQISIGMEVEGCQGELEIEVDYTYHTGFAENETDPDEPPSVEIFAVRHGGIGIYALLECVNPEIFNEIERIIVDDE